MGRAPATTPSRVIEWQPFREPLRATLLRTLTIALLVGALIALASHGRIGWPLASLLVLWPSLGGHVIDVLFLNRIRPRLPFNRAIQVAIRIIVWFLGGALLTVGMTLNAAALTRLSPPPRPAWWLGGIVFIGIELFAHLFLHLRNRPSFYNGRG